MTVSVPEPAAGADWSYTLPYAARLIAVTAQFAASATAANRWPALVGVAGPASIYAAYVYMVGTAVTASTTAQLQGQPGMSVGAPTTIAGPVAITRYSYPPTGVLPADSIIESITFNIQAGDQWSDISLVLEPA